jgi:UV DNA damage endonuclease
MMRRYGYCCINMTLGEGKKENRITTNRSMVKKTFLERGLGYASENALLNAKDLIKVIKWNNDNGIKMYRMSSDIFPWASEYEFTDLPHFEEIRQALLEAGDEAKRCGQRITFHPSPYGVLASVRGDVVTNAIKDLRQHAEIMDLMGLDQTHFYPINIHVNTTKPTREEAAERFCQNYALLPDTVKKRLVVEVDDKKSQYTAVDLHHMVHSKIGIPITFDYLHNKCNPSHLDEKQALALCLSTWPEGVPAITHYSDSRKNHEDPLCKEVAHSDWLYEKIETYGMDFDIELEVKMKEKALLDYNTKIEKILV